MPNWEQTDFLETHGPSISFATSNYLLYQELGAGKEVDMIFLFTTYAKNSDILCMQNES